jgi:hypothetical protein
VICAVASPAWSAAECGTRISLRFIRATKVVE